MTPRTKPPSPLPGTEDSSSPPAWQPDQEKGESLLARSFNRSWQRLQISPIGFSAVAGGPDGHRVPDGEQMGRRWRQGRVWRAIHRLWSGLSLTRWLVLMGGAYARHARGVWRAMVWAVQAALVVGMLAQPLVALAQGPFPAGSEFRVNTYTTGWQQNPSVAMDAEGDFVVAWESPGQDGSDDGVYAQLYDPAGNPVGSEFRVNTYTTDDQYNPSVAMDADGDFVVAWTSSGQDGNVNGVYARRYDSSGVAQDASEFQVNTYTTSGQSSPSVAVDADGDFVVAWTSSGQDGSDFGVYAQRYNSSGVAQGSEFQVNTYTTSFQEAPSVAMDADGNFVVAWQSYLQDGSSYGVYARRYNSSGVAQDASEFQVNTYTTNSQEDPSVAVDADGDFVVAWESYWQDGSVQGVYARRYNKGGAAQDASEFQVNTYTTSHQSSPSVAMDADGDFVVVWRSGTSSESQDGSAQGVYARRGNSSGGAKDASEFLVNTYTTSVQTSPSVAARDADGDFVVAWESGDFYHSQDGSHSGVYAQRYFPYHTLLPAILKND